MPSQPLWLEQSSPMLQSAPMKPAGQWHIPVAVSHQPPFLHWHGLRQSRPYHPGEHSEGTTNSGLRVQKYHNKVQTAQESPAGGFAGMFHPGGGSELCWERVAPGWHHLWDSEPFCPTGQPQSTQDTHTSLTAFQDFRMGHGKGHAEGAEQDSPSWQVGPWKPGGQTQAPVTG